tara:strand:+ start:4366 stop:4572 length:207 start_codon:yes stop_codon:yes gene_type:complete
MEKRLEIDTLLRFLEHSGCRLYFAPAPFIVQSRTATINDCSDSLVAEKVKDYNEFVGRDPLTEFNEQG